MRKFNEGILPLMLLALLVSGVQAAGAATLGEDEVKIVPLQRILAEPHAYRGETVAFVATFHRVGSYDNPVHTQFQRDEFLNFSVWLPGTPLWFPESYKDDYPFLFVRHDTKGAELMLNAPLFSRWVITATIPSVCRDKPYILVQGLRRLDNQLDARSLSGMVHGFEAQRQGRFEDAAKYFHVAHHDDLPHSVRIVAVREEARSYYNAGDLRKAMSVVSRGLRIEPDDQLLRSMRDLYRSKWVAQREAEREAQKRAREAARKKRQQKKKADKKAN